MINKELTNEAVLIELNRLKTDSRPTIDFDRRCKAIDRAKKAVYKQIPHKPAVNINESLWRCSKCKVLISVGSPYCSSCGQALDWS